MEPWRLTVHPVYGAIYKDGEFVQRGAVLGLNAEANGVVIAPASGWVRVVRAAADAAAPERVPPYLSVEIWPQALTSGASPCDTPPRQKPV